MPRPHHPAQGGPQRAAWNRAATRKPRRASSADTIRFAGIANTSDFADLPKPEAIRHLPSRSPKATNALNRETRRADSPLSGVLRTSNPPPRSLTVLGIAAVLFVAAVVFALVVIIKHN